MLGNKYFLWLLFLIGFCLHPLQVVFADDDLPKQNPYPPQASDQQRIDFALKSITNVYQNENLVPQYTWYRIYNYSFKNKNESCLNDLVCLGQDLRLQRELYLLRQKHGRILEIKFPHLDPWSQKRLSQKYKEPKKIKKAPNLEFQGPQALADEFMVHVFVRFEKDPQSWKNLNVFLNEGESGTLQFRHFDVAFLDHNQNLPGINCAYQEKHKKKRLNNPLKSLNMSKVLLQGEEYAKN